VGVAVVTLSCDWLKCCQGTSVPVKRPYGETQEHSQEWLCHTASGDGWERAAGLLARSFCFGEAKTSEIGKD
jgi:hypothetical protein